MRLLSVLVLAALLMGCMAPEERMTRVLDPLIDRLPEIARAIREADSDGGDVVIIIGIELHWLNGTVAMPASIQVAP